MRKAKLHKWESGRTDVGSECAKKIRKEIERLSPFTLKPVGVAVESGYVENLHVESKHLDYGVFYGKKKIAEIEVSCPNYTFEGSKIMPVNLYKGKIIEKLNVPAFIVFSMEKEKQPLKDRCVWIKGEDVIKCDHWTEELGGKMQHNYFTDKKDWHRGLEDLIKQLLPVKEWAK